MNSLDLAGRCALVTGSGRGIGRGIAEALIERGARVAINDVVSDRAEKCAAELGPNAFAAPADVSSAASVASLVESVTEEFGSIDILVNNAGVDNAVSILDMSEDEWDRVLQINLKSVFLCTKAVLPQMIAQGRGRVISTSSVVARQGAMNGGIHYAASKGAIMAFSKTLARQFAAKGVTSNAIAPGVIDTDLIAEHMPAETRKKIEAAIPIGHLGTTTDIGKVVAFLASDAAAYITGATIDINGGFWIG